MPTHATGTFEVTVKPLPIHDTAPDSCLGRMSIDKRFTGQMEGTSVGEMLAMTTGVKGSAAYVAIESVSGALNGRTGTFALQHCATMAGGLPQHWVIAVVPDSGTAQLTGLTGRLTITIADGVHSYDFEYDLPAT